RQRMPTTSSIVPNEKASRRTIKTRAPDPDANPDPGRKRNNEEVTTQSKTGTSTACQKELNGARDRATVLVIGRNHGREFNERKEGKRNAILSTESIGAKTWKREFLTLLFPFV